MSLFFPVWIPLAPPLVKKITLFFELVFCKKIGLICVGLFLNSFLFH